MEKVSFTPSGIALKQHELYGLDDNLLQLEATHLYTNIVDWSLQHFLLSDDQIAWLNQQDDTFTVQFARTVGKGLINRYDFNIKFEGPSEAWKSKRLSAKENIPFKLVDIYVERIQ